MDGIAAVLAVTTLAGGASAPKAAKQSVLPVVAGAVDVVPSRGQEPTSVHYDVREPYPAPKTIGYLVDAMSERGWKLIEFGAFRPGASLLKPSKSDPASDLKRLSALVGKSHVWDAWWRDAEGRGVAFHLEYHCPMEKQGMHSVWVHVAGVLYPPGEAALQEAERRRVYEERCQAAREVGLPPDPTCAK